MNSVLVTNREQFKDIHPGKDVCAISIWSTIGLATVDYYDDIIQEGWHDFLKLEFDDVMKLMPQLDVTLFNESHAKEIIAFVERNKNVPLIVHCDAGMSRSVAVAVFLNEQYGYDITLAAAGNDSFRNIHVVSMLRRQIYKEKN